MAESKEQTKEGNGPEFTVHRIYLKDLSFESPMGIGVFSSESRPEVNQQLSTEINEVDKDLYETVLKITVTATLGDNTAFVVEVHQAGIFLIKGYKSSDITRIANTVCMQTVFPYAREAIDSSLSKGTFPPVLLPPVNFASLYEQSLEKKQQQEKKQQGKKQQRNPKRRL